MRAISFAFSLALFVAVVATAATHPTQPRIIDVHTHPEFKGPDARREYLKEWDEAGLIAAVGILHTHNGMLPDLGDRDVTFCAGLVGQIDLTALEGGLKSGKYGCIKIYLGYEPYWAYDVRYAPVYELAEKYDVPVVFHTGDTDRTSALLKYADPLTIDEVAVAHPKVRMVIAHCGNPWIESAAEVAYKNPNVYLDGSAFLTGDLRKQPAAKVSRYMIQPLSWIFGYIENPKKLMFGSDWPVTNIPSAVEAFKQAIPERYWSDVFCSNAVRVFKLHPRQGCQAK
jgi:hypothetical protein